MSGQLRALKNRIRSVENTKKITRAMEMVAAAKLRRFQDMMVKARPFLEGLEKLLQRISNAGTHPFFEKREPFDSAQGGELVESEKKPALVLITSDAGLCGSYNNNLIQLAKRFFAESKEKPVFIGIGKSGISAVKKMGHAAHATFTDMRASQVESVLQNLRVTLENLYLNKEVDSIYVVYSHFLTVSKYQESLEKLLPFEQVSPHPTPLPLAGEGKKQGKISPTISPLPLGEGRVRVDTESDYIFEPSREIIFNKLIPLYFEAKVRMIFLESFVSEQIARMTAMHQATDNAKEMIDSLVLLRNKARQAAITKEIIEIVSGSQALKIK